MSCTLVLLPGMDGTGEMFAPLIRELGPDIQTVVVRYPDLPLDYAAHEAFARARLPSIGPFVVVTRLEKVRLPGLYIRATHDRLVTKAAAQAFARSAVNARVVDIEGPHLLLQTNPREAAHVLRTFMHEASATTQTARRNASS
jgi:surfactin synthase thioesterase subunit